MPSAQILAAWVENGQACMAAAVNEGGQRVEYVGRVPVDDDWQAASAAQKKAALVAAVKAERDRTRSLIAPTPTDLGITGSVTV